jgi:hypothetical protein
MFTFLYRTQRRISSALIRSLDAEINVLMIALAEQRRIDLGDARSKRSNA